MTKLKSSYAIFLRTKNYFVFLSKFFLMPVNRNALIRYNTIDNCLKNRHRLWTLEDLIDACSDALYEFEGIDKGVSRRTVQMDLQMMRSEKLGYNAPIIVKEKKYYTYEDPNYSITNIPLTDQDLSKLTEVVEILRQFKGFTHFKELSGMVQRLEDKVHTSKTQGRSIIDLEKNENLKGLEYIDTIYHAILQKKAIKITYQSFKARQADTFEYHAFLLKEHRNRWFALGRKSMKGQTLLLALDRIESLQTTEVPLTHFDEEQISNYFKDVIGVTVNENQPPQEIRFIAPHDNAPYLITKPLHHSQRVVESNEQGVLFSMHVQLNFELERDILAFGDRIKVISPPRLRSTIKDRLTNAIDQYLTELDTKSLKHYPKRLDAKGFIITNHVFSRKTINLMKRLIKEYKDKHPEQINDQIFSIRKLFQEIPQLIPICLSHNLKRILNSFSGDFFLTKAVYFDKPPQSNWYVTWHQDIPINVKEKVTTEGYHGWTQKKGVTSVMPPDEILHNTITIRIHLDDTTKDNGALKIIPGSHKRRHTDDQIQVITEHSLPHICEVQAGGVQMMRPLLLHSSSKTTNQKSRRVIHLEFNTMKLGGDLEWEEMESIHHI